MVPSDSHDLGDSWIEVTPQSLGYNQNGSSYSGSQEPGGLHTIVEERLLSLFLSEAQEHSDRASDGSLPSPLSHDELHSGDTSEQSHSTYQNINFPVTSSGEWASRPEIGAYTALACQTNDSKESVSSPPNCSSLINGSWYLRNSAFMKSRFIGWLLDHIPNILSHATTFLLGAITMLLFIRKRARFTKVLNIPLD
ncbi:unnamed protein product [Schistosoma margrebowiei]|uniref:Uncharacterized protein n=1 Tax=Schistosoma margrebowiei TaxID=48269 RepID=A0AA85ABT2_9TREM|nr:unnamed protein product [Schistosoma margrebowiei]